MCDLHCVVQGDRPCRVAANMLPQYRHCVELQVRIGSLKETPNKMCLRNKEREGMSEDDAGGPFGSHACELSALLSYVEDHTGSGKNFPQYELWCEFQAESPIMGTLGTCSPLGRNPKSLGSLENLGNPTNQGSPKVSLEPWAPPLH